jgi:hypothetical protein
VYGREIKPVWRTSSFLVYTGGLTVLAGGLAAVGYLSTQYSGGGARTAWAFLILFVLWLLAEALRRAGPWVAAGIFAFTAVIAWAYFIGSAWAWFGWLDNWNSPFQGWSLAHLSLEFLILVAALVDRRRWRFPFIGVISAVAGWFFVTDFISNGGWWTYVVTLVIGLAYLLAGTVSDQPSAFWLHFVAGLLIGVPILHWFHTSDFDFAVVLVVSLIFVLLGHATRRSSWAVFGTIGFFVATIHYIVGSPTALAESFLGLGSSGSCVATPAGESCTGGSAGSSGWSFALGFGLLGFWLVLLGLLGRRRRTPAEVVAVEPMPAGPASA